MHSHSDSTDAVLIISTMPDGGSGVFAARDIAAGETIGRFEGTETATRTRMSLQFGADVHVDPGEHILRFLNHACDPTAVFSGRVLVARRALAAGAELTIDYTCHEPVLAFPFHCDCGSVCCVGMVRGWERLDARQREARRDRAGVWLLPGPTAAMTQMLHCRRGGP